MQPEFLSKQSVAAFFDTSISTVARWIEKGVLPAPVSIGGMERWPVASLVEAACGAMDKAAKNRPATADVDRAMEEAINEARTHRKAKAGRWHG